MNNVDYIEIGPGVDKDSWHIQAICGKTDNGDHDPFSVTYTSYELADKDLEKIAQGLASGEKVIRLDEHFQEDQDEDQENVEE